MCNVHLGEYSLLLIGHSLREGAFLAKGTKSCTKKTTNWRASVIKREYRNYLQRIYIDSYI